MDDLEKRVHEISNYPSSKISIACSGMEYERFTPLIHKFQEEYPDIQVMLQWCNPTLARQLVYTKMIDFSFLLSIENHDDCIGQMPFFYDQLDIIMSNYHPLANRDTVRFEDLQNEKYIVINSGTNQIPFNHIVDHFKKIGVEFKGGMLIADSLDSLVLQVSAGLGIGMLSHQVSNIYGQLVSFVPLEKDFMCVQTDLVWNNNRPNPAKNTFIDFVRSENSPFLFEN
jgi:DNA-binding transcriptional LysR family regulator